MKKEKLIKQTNTMNEDYEKAVSFFVVLAIVLVFIGGLYFISVKFIDKNSASEEETTEPTYDQSLLLVDNMLSVSDGEYYVLVYDKNDKTNADAYTSLVSSYKSDKINLYTIDLSRQMNKKYYDQSKNESFNKDSWNFIQPTLLTIKKGKITNTNTVMSDIIKKLS